jgi:hypothetical protein
VSAVTGLVASAGGPALCGAGAAFGLRGAGGLEGAGEERRGGDDAWPRGRCGGGGGGVAHEMADAHRALVDRRLGALGEGPAALPRCTTAHPPHTGSTNRLGSSVSEATTRPARTLRPA